MAALGNKVSLAIGQAVKLNSAPITGAGTLDFVIVGRGEADISGIFQAIGTVTTLTAALQISLDNGVTFVDYVAAANFLSNTGPVLQKLVTPLLQGATYRINITVASGSIDIWALR